MKPTWRSVHLGDVAEEVTVGFVGKMSPHYVREGIPFLRSQDVRPFRIDLNEPLQIDPEFHERISKSALRSGDVVTVRTGKPGATAVVPEGISEMNCADLLITRPGPEIDARWLCAFINVAAAHHVISHLVGAVQQHFNVGAMKRLPLLMPSLSEQRAIAEVLGALDDKIAANDRLIDIASELLISLAAQTDSTVPVRELAVHSRTSVNPSHLDGALVRHYSLPAFDASKHPSIESAAGILSGKFAVEGPAVLISKLNPRFPRVWDIPRMCPHSLASTEFVVLRPRDVSTSVLWAVLSQPGLGQSLVDKASGTSGSHQRVRPEEILDAEVRDPRELNSATQDAITGAGNRIQQARLEAAKLAALRDALLPELMSGRMRVKDAVREAEEVL